MSKSSLFFIAGCLMLTLGCDGKKAKPSADTAGVKLSQQQSVANQEPTPPPSCGPDVSVEVITGNCEGEWSVSQVEDFQICEFKFKNAVKCPKDMNSADQGVACTGSFRKKVGVGQNISKPSDCMTYFGAIPKGAAYKLNCCKE